MKRLGFVLTLVFAGTLLFGDTAATSTGTVLWKADAEGTLSEEWASLATNDRCAVTTSPGRSSTRFYRVDSPDAQGSYAWKSAVVNGDRCFSERAEAGQGNPIRSDIQDRLFKEGDERWISYQVRLAKGFPVDPGTWQVVSQLKQSHSYGSPIMAHHVQNGRWQMHRTTNNPKNQWPSGFRSTFPLGAAKTGVWTKWTWHVKFSPNPSVGYLSIRADLRDGQGMRKVFASQMSTMKIADDTDKVLPVHTRIGVYRNSTIAGNDSALYDGYTVATTRRAAEANAFGT